MDAEVATIAEALSVLTTFPPKGRIILTHPASVVRCIYMPAFTDSFNHDACTVTDQFDKGINVLFGTAFMVMTGFVEIFGPTLLYSCALPQANDPMNRMSERLTAISHLP